MKTFILLIIFFTTLIADEAFSQWRPTNGPGGGTVNAIAKSGIRIIIGTNGGIFRSDNNGDSWTECNSGLSNKTVGALAVNGSSLFAGTFGGGIFRSTDNGDNWVAINNGLGIDQIHSIITTGNGVFVGSGGPGGIYRTTNDGDSWINVTDVAKGLNGNTVSLTACDNDIYAGLGYWTGGTMGIFRSTDNGTSWTKQDYWNNIIYLSSHNNVIFAATYNNGLLETTNNGTTWSGVAGFGGSYPQCLGVCDSIFLVKIGNIIYRYNEINKVWESCFQNGLIETVTCFFGDGIHIYAGTSGGGVFLSTDSGTNWLNANKGVSATDISCLTSYGNNIFAAISENGVYHSSDNGSNWIYRGMKYRYPKLTVDGNILVAGTYGGGINQSSDNGQTWISSNSGLTSNWIITIATKDSLWFTALDATGIFKSTNKGTSWTSSYTFPVYTNATNIEIIGNNIFCGTYNIGIYRSTNGGSSWASSNNGLTNLNVRSFSSIEPYIFAGTAGGVFRSDNNGETWTVMNNGLINTDINSLACIGTTLFAGTSTSGVFLSENFGTNWNPINEGLEDVLISSLKTCGAYLYAGTSGNGVWSRGLAEIVQTGIFDKENGIPVQYMLNQNYPNPFNPTTTLSFNIPSRTFVSLKVFDLLGREVATIVSEEMPAGNYIRQWNANKFTSGIYFYRLQAGSYSETKKLVLLR